MTGTYDVWLFHCQMECKNHFDRWCLLARRECLENNFSYPVGEKSAENNREFEKVASKIISKYNIHGFAKV